MEWVENDGSFAKAFSSGTCSAAEQRAIGDAPGAWVLYVPVDLHRERAAVVRLIRVLAGCGALAVRVEESKLGYAVAQWLALVDSEDPWSLYRAVVMVLSGDGQAVTRGMRVFSLPDAQVALDEGLDAEGANALLGSFNVYQLAEDPLLLSGQRFSPDASSPKRVLERWPDDVYPRDHVCNNPFGVWRLGPPGGAGRAPRALAVVPVPALVAVLGALEQRRGRPLTRADVEETAAAATSIAVEHLDARALERSRGYADIEPERAWEQWLVLRSER
jgi:hypothetical protein